MKILQQHENSSVSVILLLLILIGICYSNSIQASWHLDDYSNITQNSGIHIDTLSFDALHSCFINTTPSGGSYRPVAYFTFALNWLWGKDHVAGYHLVNLLIHTLAAFFLFLSIRQLLMTPNAFDAFQNNSFFIALLSSALWAVHPIQIQAVTYIVQRMASMAALFYIIAMWAYISGRLSPIFHRKILWYAGCLLAFIFGVLTKQNVIMIPIIFVIIEFCFFQDWNKAIVKRCYLGIIIFGVIIVAGTFIFLLMNGDAGPFMGKYKIRPFTPIERLLTQFRVLVFYISQIMYPISSKFSITHDFSLSYSIFTPWTTLPALLIVIGMIGASFWAISKGPFLKISGFVILFFFVNHLIESSILPLEMVFEHRNYLPTVFLFVPVSIGIIKSFDYYQKQSRPMFYFLILSTCALLMSLGISTYFRNMDWRTEKTLWQDAMIKAPKSARPLHNLAWAYYAPEGQLQTAIALYHRALELQDDSIGFESTTYSNLASIYYSPLCEYKKTIEYSLKTLQINGNHDRAIYLLAASLAQLASYDDALKVIGPTGNNNEKSPIHMHLKGLILLNISKPESALAVFRQCLALDPNNWLYLREVGFSFLMLNLHNQADWFFQRAKAFHPNQPEILLGLAATRLEAGYLKDAEKYIEDFIHAVGTDNIEFYWIKAKKSHLGLPIPFQRLSNLISQHLIEKSYYYSEMSSRLSDDIDDN